MTFPVQSVQKHLPLVLLLLQPFFALSASAQASAPAASTPIPITLPPSETLASPQKIKPKPHGVQIPKIGVNVDIFFPSSRKTRDRFGKSWSGIGIGLGRPDRPSGTGRISFDFGASYKKSGDHHEFVAPLGMAYRRAFSAEDVRRDATFIPYYGISADLFLVDLRSPEDNVHSRFRLSEGGSLVLGTTIGESGFVEGKYTAVARVQGFDLSGLKLSAGIRF